MSPEQVQFVVGIVWTLVAFCVGGLAGLYLAWSQEIRMAGWARRVAELHEAVKDAEQRGALR